MNRIDNSQKIDCIIMKPRIIVKCKLGQDWYTNDLEIYFVPDLYYPDYIEVESYIMRELDGSELNIEEVVAILYDKIMQEFSPKKLRIVDNVCSPKTHFSVSVIKGDLINE